MNKKCKHEWYVVSKAQQSRSLMVECLKCMRCGFINNPNNKEWDAASEAEAEPYLWEDNSRVEVWPEGQ